MKRKGNGHKVMGVEKKVQENDLQLYNVVVMKTEENQEIDFKKIEEIGTKLRTHGIYQIAPIVIHKDCIKNSFELMFSVNRKVDISVEEMIDFHDKIIFSRCRYYRFLSEENSISSLFEYIKGMMHEENIFFNDIFFVLIPIPNGKVIDVFVPIVEESENEQV